MDDELATYFILKGAPVVIPDATTDHDPPRYAIACFDECNHYQSWRSLSVVRRETKLIGLLIEFEK